MVYQEEILHKITGAILMNYLANFYNEQIKHTPIYKQRLKNMINNTIKELTKAESEVYEKVYEIDENELGHKLSSNLIDFLNEMIKDNNFIEFCKLQEIVMAYNLDPKRISGISDQILKENNNKFIQK